MSSLKQMQHDDAKQNFADFEQATKDFYDGDLSIKDYKSMSGKYGSFAERNKRGNVLRIRNSTGRISKEKLKFVVEEAKKHKVEALHFATCQTIQFHHLNEEQLFSILNDIGASDYLTYGTGGNYPRNTMCSPLAGVDPDEIMDISMYAQAAADFLVQYLEDPKMPRKLKTAFGSDRQNQTHATYRDLGFVATSDHTFDVYAAGGLGPNPKFGVKVAESIDPKETLYYVRAMVDTFKKYGNTKDSSRARTRYMVESLGGEEAFKAKYLEELTRIKEEMDLTIDPKRFDPITKSGDGSIPALTKRILPQKQEGLYSVWWHPIGGFPSLEVLEKVSQAIEEMDQVELRSAPDQSLYIIHCTGKEADRIASITEEDCAQSEAEAAVCCVGASTCQVGVRDSQQLIHTIVKKLRENGVKENALPKIHISGCPSSCAAQQTAPIGFRGTVKVIDAKTRNIQPAFLLTLFGRSCLQDSCMGKEMGLMLEKDIPDFLVEVAKKVEQEGSDYETWVMNDPEKIEQIARKYIDPKE